MIIKKQSLLNNEFSISIPYIDVNYLKQINEYFLNTNILEELFNKATTLSIAINNLKRSDFFFKIINNIEIYYEGINSSKIEDICLTTSASSLQNKTKIKGYIDGVEEIYQQEEVIDIKTIEAFHHRIEPNKEYGIRKNLPQYINGFKAPEGKALADALNNFFDIYLAKDGFDDINIFVRWAYQHLLFETIHPFDDGNGRTGRMLNLMFFKNQHNDIFDNLLLETSSLIFEHLEQYYKVLDESHIYIRNEPYSSDITKSISKDIAFIKYMLDRLNDKLSYTLAYVDTYNNNINQVISDLNKDPFLKKYMDQLLAFFSTHIYFTRKELKDSLMIAEATSSKIMEALEKNGFIKDSSKYNNYKNSSYKVFVAFENIKESK